MQEERYGTRDRTYSAWHRRMSTRRYIGIENAQLLAMIDLDASLYVEYDDETKEPLALIETAADVGQPFKTATVTQKLAILASLPAFVVLYKKSARRNPADPEWSDIDEFRVRRVWPEPENEWRTFAPKIWADQLLKLRKCSALRIDEGLRVRLDPLERLQIWWDLASYLDRQKFADLVLMWVTEQEAQVA